jgi:serine protease Do
MVWAHVAQAASLLSWPAGAIGAAAAPESARQDLVVRAVERVMPSVVNIATEEVVSIGDPMEQLFRDFFGPYYRQRPPNTQHSLGSGVIVDEEGYIVTNYHVVARARRIWVRLFDGRELEAQHVGGTSETDVALVKIQGDKDEKFKAVRLAPDDDLLLGETVIALGNPFGLGGSVSRGILSSKSRRPPREGEALDVMDWLQTDAAINPGNSGGPLINLDGDLIGINVAVYREAQGIGFALPVKRLAAAIARVYSPEALTNLWFGATIRPGLMPLEVMTVEPESPAQKGGLKAGDRILQIDQETPQGYFHFQRRLLEIGDKRSMELQVQRGAERHPVTLRLVPESSFFNEALVRKRTGLSVQKLTPELARVLGLGRIQGLLVGGVEPQSPAAVVGLEQGMVITGMAGQTVTEVVQAARLVHGKGPGEKVTLDLVIARQRGLFYLLEQGNVELTLR